MKFAVVQFPGSNCDQDCFDVLSRVLGQEVRYAWHKDTRIDPGETVILPGGFSYGDYLRGGAIAAHSPIMAAVKEAAERGQYIIGICNGFQILCEVGLLPGALVRNERQHFICGQVRLRAETPHNKFTHLYPTGETLHIPIAHGEGRYFIDDEGLDSLIRHDQVLFRYCDSKGRTNPPANPNGSVSNIAGICNRQKNVLGMMPHPERACEKTLGSTDGKRLFENLIFNRNVNS